MPKYGLPLFGCRRAGEAACWDEDMNYSNAHIVTLYCAAFSKLVKGVERCLLGTGCTLVQYRILLQLEQSGAKGMRTARLARALASRPSVIVTAADALEQRGLVCVQEEICGGAVAVPTEAAHSLTAATKPRIEVFFERSHEKLACEDTGYVREMLYDALAVPGGVFVALRPDILRGDALPLAYQLTAMISYTQVVGATAKGAADLSFTDYRFLLELLPKRRGVVKRLRAKDMVAYLRVNRSYVTTAAYRLEERGFIVRDPDPDDARGVLFGLTPTGELLVRGVGDDIASTFESMYGMRSWNPMRLVRVGKLLAQGADEALASLR